MKKITKVLLVMALVTVCSLGMLPTNKAEAATSPWFSVPSAGSGCQVRVWTDYDTYTATATTVDTYAETNGKCGTIYYSAFVEDAYSWISSETHTGYFTSRTPTKKFYISKFQSRSFNPVTASVTFQLYSNSSHSTTIGSAWKNITYYQK